MKPRQVWILLLIATLGGCFALLSGKSDLLVNLEMKSIDFRMLVKGNTAISEESRTVVVLIDDPALKPYPYRSPVPRDMLAKLITTLHHNGAKLIGLDVLLKERSWEREDVLLRSSMENSGKVVLVSAMRRGDENTVLDEADPYFLGAALASGVSDIPIDPADQVVRRMHPAWSIGGKETPALSTLLYLLSTGEGGDTIPALDIADRYLWDGGYLIRMTEPPSTVSMENKQIPVYPASALLTGYLPAEWFQDKVVLIGAGYEDNTDSYRTPYYTGAYGWPLTPGVEIHAAALETLQQQRFVVLPAPSLIFILAFGLGLLLLIVESRTNPLAGGVVLVLTLIVYALYALYRFDTSSEALPVVPISLALVLSFGLAVIYRALTEGRQKRWIQGAFGRYVSPDLVSMLVRRPEGMKLGGEEKELTVLFSDLQGFTTLSEGLSPTELVSLLNEYLEGMTDIILRHRGTLDKYEGDAIMAFWGAPLDDPDHALHAVQAALEMREFLAHLNERFKATGKPELVTRIGINSGKVVVGNIGSRQRFDYTVIGDEVNLASRLEGANKAYGTHLMIGERTRNLIGDAVMVRELDLIRVKGKRVPVQVFEVLSQSNGKDAVDRERLELFASALEQYRRRNWNAAEAGFQAVLDNMNDDAPSQVYLERCRLYAKTPPPEEWDGVFSMQSK